MVGKAGALPETRSFFTRQARQHSGLRGVQTRSRTKISSTGKDAAAAAGEEGNNSQWSYRNGALNGGPLEEEELSDYAPGPSFSCKQTKKKKKIKKSRNAAIGACGGGLRNGKRYLRSDSLREDGDCKDAGSSSIVIRKESREALELQQQQRGKFMEVETALECNYPYVPGLNDELALLCLARVPRVDYEQFFHVNRKFCDLARSGELYKIRRRNAIVEQWVYMLASGQVEWQAFDPKAGVWRRLPVFDADYCYYNSDRESFSVGTQLLVVGRHAGEGLILWRYDLVSDNWSRGPMMLTPRCLYAWASCGRFAYVAGGCTLDGEFLKSAERYDPDCRRWECLPDMNVPRKLCAGCYLGEKIIVVGGENQDGDLSSGEVYDPSTKTWSLIPGMLPGGTTGSFPGAPPLIAVVKDRLYSLEAKSNQLKVYIQSSNTWRVLGGVPVRADLASGWGIAFKALGDELLVIGGARSEVAGYGDGMYTCRPDPEGGELRWCFVTRLLPFGPFIFNCAIMAA